MLLYFKRKNASRLHNRTNRTSRETSRELSARFFFEKMSKSSVTFSIDSIILDSRADRTVVRNTYSGGVINGVVFDKPAADYDKVEAKLNV